MTLIDILFFQDNLEYVDDLEDVDYQPESETENRGKAVHPIDFIETILFAERFTNLSNFQLSSLINLIAKAYNVTDPSLLISEHGIRNQKARVRQRVLENHKENTKELLGIKVVTIIELQASQKVFTTFPYYGNLNFTLIWAICYQSTY